jgi:hypothetical protein
MKQYFFPLAAGYWRAYHSPDESFWCCTGTGVEEFAKFVDSIYFRHNSDVYVNQFIASTLDWKDEGFGIEQVTKFPEEQGTTLKIKTSRPSVRTIHVRIPSWTTEDAEIKINGRSLEAVADPGSYLAVRRPWKDGDTISVSLPMTLRQEPLLGDDSVTAALYGPLVLAADLGAGPTDGPLKIIHGRPTTPGKALPKPDPLPKVAAGPNVKTQQWVQTDSKSELRFSVAGEGKKYDVMPMYRIRDQKYSIYWQTPPQKT